MRSARRGGASGFTPPEHELRQQVLAHYQFMSMWAVVASLYGAVLTAAALARPVRRRPVAVCGALAYGLTALAVGSLPLSPSTELVAPAAFLLTGYWLSGLFFTTPQPGVERALLRLDRAVFDQLDVDRRLCRAPRWWHEALELAYVSVHVAVAVGALVAAWHGVDAVRRFWDLVLTAELMCYAALPWLRTRPPRALEGPGAMARRAPRLRSINASILDRASVQANTLPSGHVAGAVAAGLGVIAISPVIGGVLLALAGLIGVAAVIGRYHYVVDSVTGAIVALAVWLFLG